ncbi:MAG: tyrosine-protein phosphatase [Clostridia bacterium]|nr:tyrosine-protein phosphatase [Clostridia bacterium]
MIPGPDGSRYPLIRLPLHSYHNVRDIGGYAGTDGRAVRFGRFFRASEPVGINPEDIRTLIDFPVRTFVDLRTELEVRTRPSVFQDLPGVRYRNFSLLKPLPGSDKGAEDLFLDLSSFSLGEVYIHMLETAGDEIAGVLAAMADETEGACLYHCTHGKDRTGLITMLLYRLAGVADEDIVASYQVSFSYLHPLVDPLIAVSVEGSRHLLRSDAENMEMLLHHFDATRPGILPYLHEIGLDDRRIRILRERLLFD